MYDLTTDPRLPLLSSFTDSERRECLPVIELITMMANIARKYGVLALEEKAKELPESAQFLKTGLMLIVDGTDPEIVRKILKNYVLSTCVSHDGQGNAGLLRRMMEVEGILSVQMGENPRIIEETMLSMLGENFNKEARAFLDAPTVEESSPSGSPPIDISGLPRIEGIQWLNDALLNLSDRDIQHIVNSQPQIKYSLTTAMRGLSEAAQERLIFNMSRRSALTMIEDIKYYSESEADIEKAQFQVMSIIEKLQSNGEIIIAWGSANE